MAYVIDAVYAAAFGLHETLKEKCKKEIVISGTILEIYGPCLA